MTCYSRPHTFKRSQSLTVEGNSRLTCKSCHFEDWLSNKLQSSSLGLLQPCYPQPPEATDGAPVPSLGDTVGQWQAPGSASPVRLLCRVLGIRLQAGHPSLDHLSRLERGTRPSRLLCRATASLGRPQAHPQLVCSCGADHPGLDRLWQGTSVISAPCRCNAALVQPDLWGRQLHHLQHPRQIGPEHEPHCSGADSETRL